MRICKPSGYGLYVVEAVMSAFDTNNMPTEGFVEANLDVPAGIEIDSVGHFPLSTGPASMVGVTHIRIRGSGIIIRVSGRGKSMKARDIFGRLIYCLIKE